MPRDPRVDPRPGDVIRGGRGVGIREVVSVSWLMPDAGQYDTIAYRRGTGRLSWSSHVRWMCVCADAEIVKVTP